MRQPRRRAARAPGPLRAWVLVVLTVSVGSAAAGCTSADVLPDGPFTLIEAYRLGRGAAASMDRDVHLVGFIGHEGAHPAFLDGLLGEFGHGGDLHDDRSRADGRALVWTLLFATPRGGLVRAVVAHGAPQVEVDQVSGAEDPVIRQLWALNLGGRLLVDSPAAMEALATTDTQTGELLATADARQGRLPVVYASNVVVVDPDAGVFDLVYEFFIGAPVDDTPYARWGQVRHVDGVVVAVGDEKPENKGQEVTLVDEEFELSPVLPEVRSQATLETTVREVRLVLDVEGAGSFSFRIMQQGQELVRIDDDVLGGPTTYERDLEVLEPDIYGLEAEATGKVAFRLVMTGLVGF